MKRLFLVLALSTVLPGQVKSPELPVVSDAGAFSLNSVLDVNYGGSTGYGARIANGWPATGASWTWTIA